MIAAHHQLTRETMSIDLMTLAEGAAGVRADRSLSDLRGKSLNSLLLAAFESKGDSEPKSPSSPRDMPSSPKRFQFEQPVSPKSAPKSGEAPAYQGFGKEAITDTLPYPVSETSTPKAKPDIKVDIRAGDPVDDGLASPPSLSDNPFKRSDSLKGNSCHQKPSSSAATSPRGRQLSSNVAKLSGAFSGSATTEGESSPTAPSDAERPRNSVGDNPFLRSDSAKKATVKPPWEKTALPVGGTQTGTEPTPSVERKAALAPGAMVSLDKQPEERKAVTAKLAEEVVSAAVAHAMGQTPAKAADETLVQAAVDTEQQPPSTINTTTEVEGAAPQLLAKQISTKESAATTAMHEQVEVQIKDDASKTIPPSSGGCGCALM